MIGFLFGGAFWWLARMGRPAPPERFLNVEGAISDQGFDNGGTLSNVGWSS